jgi:translation initiation factor 1A
MVKNSGGKQAKKMARKNQNNQEQHISINDISKTDEQEYAIIDKVLGGGRFNIITPDNKKRIGISRGRMFSRNGKVKDRSLMTPGNLILVSLRDFQDDKADILMFYTKDQVNLLLEYDEIDKNFMKVINDDTNNNENIVDDIFDDNDDDKDDDMKLEDIWDDI